MTDYFSTPEFVVKLARATERRFKMKNNKRFRVDRHSAYLDAMNSLDGNDAKGRLHQAVMFYSNAPEDSLVSTVSLRDALLFSKKEVEDEIDDIKQTRNVLVEVYKASANEALEKASDDSERDILKEKYAEVLAGNLYVRNNLDRLLVLNYTR
jgi:hypothetical protein